MLRRQLPAYSPLSARAVWAAFGTGDARAEVVETLRSAYGATEVVLTDSGTSALALALKAAAARRPGLPCAMPAYACYDLATAALAAGVRVVLYDLDPLTLAPDAASLKRALSGGAAALVVVHLYGVPVPMDLMLRAADQADALLIEDAAQGIGGAWGGRPLGATGAMGVLSFGRGKGMTGGGGGALLVRDGAALPADRRGLGLPLEAREENATFGVKLVAQWMLSRPRLYAVPASIPALRLGETILHEPGAICGMPAAAARVLRETLPLSAEEAVRRCRNADRLRVELRDSRSMRLVSPAAGGTPGWLRLPVLMESGLDDRADRLGIMRGYPLALSALPEIAAIRTDREPMAGAERLARELWTLPTHTRLTDADLGAIVRWMLQDPSSRR